MNNNIKYLPITNIDKWECESKIYSVKHNLGLEVFGLWNRNFSFNKGETYTSHDFYHGLNNEGIALIWKNDYFNINEK